jgi:ketosteroid isomerase-like protein
MPADDRLELVRGVYRAFASADRDFIESVFADDLTFSSPVDVGLDRAGYFERCWPGAGANQAFDFVRLVEAGGEVIVTYEMSNRDGSRGRNTEVLTFRGDQISKVEVYFGWTVE